MTTTATVAMITQACVEHPTLIPVKPKCYAGADQALINVRKDLTETFHGMSFRVTLNVRRGGASVLRVRWTEWPDATVTNDQIGQYLQRRWATCPDARTMPFEERQRMERFRTVFGSVEKLQLEPEPPTPEQWVRHERAMLKRTMNDPVPDARTTDPTILPARRPRL